MVLPGAEQSTSYGTAAMKVRGKLFARLREDGESVVLFTDPSEREALIQADSATFFTTPHYEGHPIVLVHLDRVEHPQLQELLLDSWRRKAPHKLVKEFDGELDDSRR